MNRLLCIAFLIPAALSTLSCGTPLCVRAGAVSAIGMAAGAEVQLRAGQLDVLEECDRPAPPGVRWSSSVPDVATIDDEGVVRAVRPGTTEIVARYRRVVVRTPIEVIPAVARIELMPADTTIAVGDTVVFTAVAYGTDGSVHPSAKVLIYPSGGHTPESIVFALNPASSRDAVGTSSIPIQARFEGTAYIVAWVVGLSDSARARVRPRDETVGIVRRE